MNEPRTITAKEVVKSRKRRHMKGFEKAFQRAVDDAAGSWKKDFDAAVEFHVSATGNPGSVHEYRVKLTEL